MAKSKQSKKSYVRIVWAEGISDRDVQILREEVDLALTDPDHSIIANYEIHWEEVEVDKEAGTRIVSAEEITDNEIKELKEQVDLALADPDYTIVVPYEVHWVEIPIRGKRPSKRKIVNLKHSKLQ